ncbi:MAG: bifunctional helix-turn-helix transcriptional regulator/GNAT family N-acetyltransferase [Vulcanimicrobiaceae bacterium]
MPLDAAARIDGVRRFNRFYTTRIGALREGFLQSSFSLSEVRVLYELAHRPSTTAAELSRELGLDAGYLSRILRRFAERGLVQRRRSKSDGRQAILALGPRGRRTFAPIEQRQRDEVRGLLEGLGATEQERVVEAMREIEELLSPQHEPPTPYLLRTPDPGDIGWVISRHAALYAQEYGWDQSFEVFVGDIAINFLRNFDPKRERCWIAERAGRNAGCVFLVKKTDEVAQLRLLLVEPDARGLGVGRRLVEECIAFARRSRYKSIVLWTNDILHAARHIYENLGFKLTEAEKHHSFGQDLVGQYWELALS